MGRLYYYGEEMEQIQFVQMPNELIFGEEFVDLSSDAKILYCVLRNRMSLSARNNWKDEEGKVYVIYSIEEIMREFRCSKASAIRLLDELDSKTVLDVRKRGIVCSNFWKTFGRRKYRLYRRPVRIATRKRKRNHGKTVFLQDLCTHLRTAKVGRNRGIRIATSGGIKNATLVILRIVI